LTWLILQLSKEAITALLKFDNGSVEMWQPVTDLRIGQIGHGLGPRTTPSYDDSFLT